MLDIEKEAVKLTFDRDLAQEVVFLVRCAMAEEREACARLIESLPPGFGDLNRNDVAARIRNRAT